MKIFTLLTILINLNAFAVEVYTLPIAAESFVLDNETIVPTNASEVCGDYDEKLQAKLDKDPAIYLKDPKIAKESCKLASCLLYYGLVAEAMYRYNLEKDPLDPIILINARDAFDKLSNQEILGFVNSHELVEKAKWQFEAEIIEALKEKIPTYEPSDSPRGLQNPSGSAVQNKEKGILDLILKNKKYVGIGIVILILLASKAVN